MPDEPITNRTCMTKTATKKTPAVTCEVLPNGTLETRFSDGTILTTDPAQLSEDIRATALLHGLKAKLVDAAALLCNKETGRSPSIEDKIEAVREVHARITSPNGTWNKIRGDGESSGGGTGLLVRALMAVTGQTRGETEETLATCTKEEVVTLRNMPKIAAKIAEFKAAASKVDAGALLAKFGG